VKKTTDKNGVAKAIDYINNALEFLDNSPWSNRDLIESNLAKAVDILRGINSKMEVKRETSN
jgi:hypothetical protein